MKLPFFLMQFPRFASFVALFGGAPNAS